MTLLELLGLVRKHLRLVIILPVVAALLTAAYTFIVMPNTFTGSASMYVLAKSGSSDSEGTITQSELSASQQLTNDVATLIKSSRVRNDTAKALGLEDLKGFNVSVDSQTNTRVLTVRVTGTNPDSVAAVANQLAHSTSDVAQEVMDVQSVNIIDEASTPQSPSGPPRLRYILIAFLAGLFLAVGIVVVMDMANTRVRSAEDAAETLGVPVIGRIPVIR